jgi:hypothetical protein
LWDTDISDCNHRFDASKRQEERLHKKMKRIRIVSTKSLIFNLLIEEI